MMQIIAIVWTAIAVVLALALVITLFAPVYSPYLFPGTGQPGLIYPGIPWQLSVLMFFGFLLILTLPAYLLLYLWHRISEPKQAS
ncbi:hypothetical protein MUP79_05900 [Candidatus Bathyarchaeota archaeon]|nr:hypothetical protein [Candidatus Bathyarchaeota archaeon]